MVDAAGARAAARRESRRSLIVEIRKQESAPFIWALPAPEPLRTSLSSRVIPSLTPTPRIRKEATLQLNGGAKRGEIWNGIHAC